VALHQLTLQAFPPDYPGINIGLRSDYSRFAPVPASEINRALSHVYKLQAQDASLRNDAGLLLEEAMLLKTNGARIGEAASVLERAHRLAPGNTDISAEFGLLLAVPEESSGRSKA
jgi:hypothetical protein